MLRTLFCLIDNRVYTQQCAGRAEVEYETFYENKFVWMEDLLDFDSQATEEEFGTKDKLNSQGMAQAKSQKDFMPRPPTQRKRRSKSHKKSNINNPVVRVFTSSVHKTAFRKKKADQAQQTIQVDTKTAIDGAFAALPN